METMHLPALTNLSNGYVATIKTGYNLYFPAKVRITFTSICIAQSGNDYI